ncbi:hypothetical protein GCM10027596_14780 [Nocardioides korecus]
MTTPVPRPDRATSAFRRTTGRRTTGRRTTGRLARVLTVAVVVLAATAAGSAGVARAEAVGRPRLPRVVDAPGTWSKNAPLRGPVAAIGIALRTRPVGLRGRREQPAAYATSARDGRSVWVHLPGYSVEQSGLEGGTAVSPDGRWLGWRRVRSSGGAVERERAEGWSVMDTSTGRVRRIDVPDGSAFSPVADLAFSGDSRYLLTTFEPPERVGDRGLRGHHAFVAWDVRDGSSHVLEQPGHYFLPDLGSAPSGVVWSRGRQVFREDPATGARSVTTLTHPVVTASWAPHDAAFAYIGFSGGRAASPWRLYAGRTPGEARDRPIRLRGPRDPSQILGWRDRTHVVVGSYQSTVRVVDVVTGRQQDLRVLGSGDQLDQPLLAADLWARPRSTPVAPTGTTDPRAPLWWAAGGVVVAGLGVLLVRWRRRRPV